MDKLFINGIFHAMDDGRSVYTSLGTENGKIVYLGNGDERPFDKAGEVIDLQGKVVFPGFSDSHLHLLNYAFVNLSYNMSSETGKESILEAGRRIDGELDEAGSSDWIYGRGWNEQNFTKGEKEYLTREDLDRISLTRPILFIRSCGHIATINTAACEIVKKLPEAEQYMEEIDYDKGHLYEAAVKLCYNAMEEPSVEKIKEYIRFAQKKMNECGITSIETDNFLSLPGRNRVRIMQAFQELDEEKALTLKVREQASFVSYEDVKAFIDEGHRTNEGTEFYQVGPIKLYIDGSLGAKTALMNEPYENDGDNRGLYRHSKEELQKIVDYSYDHGMQILVHAIGDGAADMVMDAYENTISKYGRKELRLGINHLQVVNPNLFDRMKKYNILAYIQPVFVPSDKGVVAKLVGKEREKLSYLWKTMIEKGLHCLGGSDSPVESFDILSNIQTAVTRDGLNERTEGWHPEEKLSKEEAIKLFTIWNAYGTFEEERKGSLELGKACDFVVLDSDIFEVDDHEIKDINVLETVLEGKTVYKA